MKNYRFTVNRSLVGTVEVEAENVNEALAKVFDKDFDAESEGCEFSLENDLFILEEEEIEDF